MNQETIKQLETIIQRLLTNALANVLTKDDTKSFVRKENFKQFLTKDDAKNLATKEDLKQFATKDDLKRFATRDDLKDLVTKDYFHTILAVLKEELIKEIRKIEAFATISADKNKADKTYVQALEHRVDRLEQKLA